jgi:hypothetical protein
VSVGSVELPLVANYRGASSVVSMFRWVCRIKWCCLAWCHPLHVPVVGRLMLRGSARGKQGLLAIAFPPPGQLWAVWTNKLATATASFFPSKKGCYSSTLCVRQPPLLHIAFLGATGLSLLPPSPTRWAASFQWVAVVMPAARSSRRRGPCLPAMTRSQLCQATRTPGSGPRQQQPKQLPVRQQEPAAAPPAAAAPQQPLVELLQALPLPLMSSTGRSWVAATSSPTPRSWPSCWGA